MKKNVFKTMVAAVCVVAAGMGGMKAYNAGNQSEANMLLSENVEALSEGDYYRETCNAHCTYSPGKNCCFQNGHQWWNCQDMDKQ